MKNNNISSVLKTETKVIAYVVICLVIIVLGISYALFFEVKGNEKNQIVKAGTLEFSYANGSQITNATNSDCFIPMSNEEALTHSECEYKISITNTGTLPGNYSINLNSESVENPLALSKLKVILKKEGKVESGYPKEGTTTSLVKNEKIGAGKIINYSVQVYVDKDLITANDDEKNISIKINGSAVVNSEEVNPDMTAVDYIKTLSQSDEVNLAYDGKESLYDLGTKDNNLRYVGNSPNNYIDIGDVYKTDIYRGYNALDDKRYRDYTSLQDCNEASGYNITCEKVHESGEKILWRVIGVMNNINIVDNNNKIVDTKSLVKIIRAESIGSYSYDSSERSNNGGYGVNEWSQADVMTTLNNDAYWNKTKGKCYSSSLNTQTDCDFSGSGLSSSVKDKIAKVRWNTGVVGEVYSTNNIKPLYLYNGERDIHNGKEQCQGKPLCNDIVVRNTYWDGYIGLLYASDYGYAVDKNNRNSCLNISMYEWDKYNNCVENDWLRDRTSEQWTMASVPHNERAYMLFRMRSSGLVSICDSYDSNSIRPTMYLKPTIKIISNPHPELEYGSQENPFIVR